MAKEKKSKEVKCDCSKNGKGLGLRNMSGHKEDCPIHIQFMKEQKKEENALRKKDNALR